MRNDELSQLHLSDLARISGDTDTIDSQELVSAHLTGKEPFNLLKYPCRLDCYCAIVCRSGSFDLEINGRLFQVRDRTLVIYIPGNIVRIVSYDNSSPDNLDMVMVAAASQFIADVGMDFRKLYEDSLLALSNPCIEFSDDEFDILSQYFLLGKSLEIMDSTTRREAVRALCTSLFYFMGYTWEKKLASNPIPKVNYSRKAGAIFENFMKLVAEYHNSERSVAFYSGKLCISPKYLSSVVKKLSGKSAPQWIDSVIILEAKNLLKYSSKSVKEIAYELHFSGSPAFCKFFLKQTGLTPTDFRHEG